mmetsp:Transcript_29991/g.49520  ORF Transcript_29991/g.49520 Transcript_29991/m.49520 type:complete len:268 (-) Transcript_29991:325-1128(-)
MKYRAVGRLNIHLMVGLVLLSVVLTALSSVYLWNQYYVNKELEAPFDHLTSIVQRPFYRNCPKIYDDHDDGRSSNRAVQFTPLPSNFPPIFMISARPEEEVDPILQSWTNVTEGNNFTINIFNTYNMSRDYRNRKCRVSSWKSRLFGIYQAFFRQFLQDHPSLPYVVSIEDDVILMDPQGFRREVEWAVAQNIDFYSLKQNQKDTCLYTFGTVAQLFSRAMLLRLLNDVSNDTYCRLPIDMCIAQQGPWYVTQRPLVRHVGTRYNPK